MSKASLELGGGNWGTKDGNLLAYAQGNESSNLVPREFTFTRGSDIAATRINSSGSIEKYRENLLLQSNQFDNTTWIGRSQNNINGGQIGYDGSNDAWSCATTSGQIMGQNIVNQGVQTISVYAKGSVSNGLRIFAFGNDNVDFWFNLNTGLPDGSISSKVIDYSIEDVNGNGEWYRCSFTFSQTTNSIYFYCTDNNRSNAAGTIYIQDAQLEKGLVATSYLESGATKATSGVADNEPRIDYAGGTASLLLEPSRTNLITHSEYFDSWTKISSPTTTNNYGISPEGVQNSTRFQTSVGRLTTSITTINANETFSVYMKGSGTMRIQVGNDNFFPSVTSEWVRYEFTTTQVGSNANVQIRGNGSAVDVELYGAQYERNSYPTSYIPTYGTSDTRAADDVNDFDVSSILTGSNFTWFLDLNDYIGSDINQEFIFLGGFVNIQLRVRPDGYRFYYNNIAGGSVYPIAGSTTANKFCVSYDGNNYRLYVDGVLQATTASVGDSGWDFIKNTTGASLPLKEMQLFSTVLTDKELVDLTSPYSTYQELVTAEGLTWESPTCTTNSITELQSI